MDKETRAVIEGLLELARQPHSCCSERMDDDEPCEAEGYGDGNREEHAILDMAQKLLEKEGE